VSSKSPASATTPQKSRKVQIKRDNTVHDIEQIITDIDSWNAQGESTVDLKLGGRIEGSVLSDIWAAIATGTLSRKSGVRLIAWGLQQNIEPTTTFTRTPAFLVGLAMAESIAPEHGQDVDRQEMRKYFAIQNKGLVDPESGAAQTLVEFDPDYSIAPTLRGGQGFASVTPLVRKQIFEQLILVFRHRLEIGARRRGIAPVAKGAAGVVGKFLAELHENGIEHGSRDAQGKTIPGTRFMRIRKHAANNKQQLLDRCASLSELAQHVERSLSPTNTPALIEAAVSDFGLGIVDAFTASAAGDNLRMSRRELLEALIYDRLSSKSGDPSAGLGIQKALAAARQMGAFVSLRTAEFWMTVSFADDNSEPKLRDLSDKTHGRVAGTHWQILWHQT
jgi:hypothetical protein